MRRARYSTAWLRPSVVLSLAVGLLLPEAFLVERAAHGSAVPAIGGRLRAGAATASDQPTLLEQLRNGTPTERREAARRLAEIGDAAAATGLAESLRDDEEEVRAAAHVALWAIWGRSGNDEIDRVLQQGTALMQRGRYPQAVAAFDEVIARAPEFAEGWNKRATVYYLMGEYDRSIADCAEVIRRNPIHFGALSGFGLNYLRKGNLERAVGYFERALAVNPNLPSIELMLRQTRELLRQRHRQTI